MLRDNDTKFLTPKDITTPDVLYAALTTILETRLSASNNVIALQMIIANDLIYLLNDAKYTKNQALPYFNTAITHPIFSPPDSYSQWMNWAKSNLYALFNDNQPELDHKTAAMRLLEVERDSCITPEVDMRWL